MTKPEINDIIRLFPSDCIVKSINYGFNIYYKKQTVSFFYGKNRDTGKAVLKSKVVKFSPNEEFVTWVSLTGYKAENIATAITTNEAISNNGALNCIDHIGRKIERIAKDDKRNNDRLITLLKEIQSELKQYL